MEAEKPRPILTPGTNERRQLSPENRLDLTFGSPDRKENRHTAFISRSRSKAVQISSVLSEYELYVLNDKMELSEDSEDEETRLQRVLVLPFDHPEMGQGVNVSKKQQVFQKKRAKSIKEKLQRGMSQVTSKFTNIMKKNEQEVMNMQQENYIFSPDGQVKLVWDMICMGLIFYELLTIPFKISFDLTISETLDHCVDAMFLTDILISFNTAYYSKGTPVYNRRRIALNYLKFWFWLDLTASFPYQDVIIEILSKQENENTSTDKAVQATQSAKLLRMVRFIRFIKIVRLLRLAKLKIIFDKIEEFLQLSPIIASMLSFLQLSVFVLFWSHWLGCIFHFLAQNEAVGSNWLTTFSLEDTNWETRYINSLYWAVTTMTTVGYGDLSPQTPLERLFGIFFLLIATGIFSFTMNTIGAALQQIDQKKSDYRKRMSNINNYMKKVQLPSQLQNRVRRYLAYIWDSDHAASLHLITANLSQSLKYQFTIQVNGTILANCQVICSLFSRTLLIELTQLFKELTILPEEFIFKESNVQQDKHIYFIQEGIVNIVLFRTRQVVAKLEKHDYFGEISFFTNEARSASARSQQFSDLFYIDRQEFLALLVKHPEDHQRFCHVRDALLFKKDYSQLNVACYGCLKDDHLVANCPVVHFVVDEYIFIRVMHRSQRKLMSQFARRDVVQFHALAHIQLYTDAQERIQEFAYKTLYAPEECNLYETNNDGDRAQLQDHKETLPSIAIIRSKFRQERMEKRILRRHLQYQQDKIDKLEQAQRENMKIFQQMNDLLSGNEKALGYLKASTRMFLEDRANRLNQEFEGQQVSVEAFNEEQHSEEEEEIEYVIQTRFDRILKHYKQEKQHQEDDINKGNVHQEKANQLMLLQDFDRGANFLHYMVQNNLEGVLSEYDMVYHQQMECRARQDTDYEDTVYDDLIQFYQIEVDSLNLNQELDKSRLKQNLRYREKMVTELNRQSKKAQQLMRLPGVVKVKKGINLIKAVNKMSKFNMSK